MAIFLVLQTKQDFEICTRQSVFLCVQGWILSRLCSKPSKPFLVHRNKLPRVLLDPPSLREPLQHHPGCLQARPRWVIRSSKTWGCTREEFCLVPSSTGSLLSGPRFHTRRKTPKEVLQNWSLCSGPSSVRA